MEEGGSHPLTLGIERKEVWGKGFSVGSSVVLQLVFLFVGAAWMLVLLVGAAWVLLLVLLGCCLLEEEMRFVEDWRRLDTTRISSRRIMMSNEDE